MLRIGSAATSGMNGSGSEANLGGSEFSDSSSSVSIEDLPPSSAFSAHSPAGLLTVVTPQGPANLETTFFGTHFDWPWLAQNREKLKKVLHTNYAYLQFNWLGLCSLLRKR